MNVRVFAPAKINLTLQVGRPRADGLHPLQSLVMFADVGDIVEAAPSDAVSLSIDGEFAAGLAADESNLVLRAALALAQVAGKAVGGAALRLEKNLPIASGIGGGSADAAATLRALDALWDLNLGAAALQCIAAGLGADVPVCLAAIPVYMTGAGESWTSIPLPELAAVLINPLRPLATGEVYRQFDAMGLGADFAARPAPQLGDANAVVAEIATIGNDLAAPARALLPELDAVAQALADCRALAHGLSGSGATMFALCADRDSAAAWAEELQRAHPSWWVCDTSLAGHASA